MGMMPMPMPMQMQLQMQMQQMQQLMAMQQQAAAPGAGAAPAPALAVPTVPAAGYEQRLHALEAEGRSLRQSNKALQEVVGRITSAFRLAVAQPVVGQTPRVKPSGAAMSGSGSGANNPLAFHP